MDIVEWLRTYGPEPSRLNEAADTIERMQEWNDNAQEKIGRLEKEIERLREAMKDIDGQMRQADRYLLKESTLAALQQKDSE